MQPRSFWIQQVESIWKRRSILWLPGVRRVGKTTLTQSLRNVEYFDCELPRQRRAMEDPEAFLDSLKGKRIVLTGAMVPYSVSGSDALFNLGSAVAAAQLVPPGVYVTMNGRCFPWHAVHKNRVLGVFEGEPL